MTAAGLTERTGHTHVTVLGGGPAGSVDARGRRPARDTEDIRS
ncbi:hypothetical protein [Streptomyces albogriseolus]